VKTTMGSSAPRVSNSRCERSFIGLIGPFLPKAAP
jgi:hypothetical protein